MRLDAFPRHPLTFGPSPIHPLERLGAHLGGARLWTKRDDCNSGLAFGGNKTRKLEYLVADALAKGCDTLVSIGGVQSNHTRQVAAAAARTGLGCVLVQESWVDWPDVVYDRVGNIQLSRIMGADVRLVEAGFGIGFKDSWEQALADVEAAGGKPYAIPAGASDHELGGLGFASWAMEVADQERELGLFFDTVVVCSVTGSTQAGMVAGFAAQERERRVIGIDGSAKPEETREQVARIARSTAALIEAGRDLRDDEIMLDDRYHAGTYGIPDEQTLDAIRTAGRLEGMITDPVYEGKSMAGMIDLVSSGEIDKDSNVLYAHLGGQPALSAYAGLFQVTIAPETAVGAVRLRVADLDSLVTFYERAIGLRTFSREDGVARLGPEGGRAIVELVAAPGAPPRPAFSTGLFHLAILVPTRMDLARALRRVAEVDWGLTGASDHLVSEALYLNDPEGNGIELYRDRPRDAWRTQPNGELAMATLPLDLQALASEVGPHGAGEPEPMPAGTRIGHVHLQVSDLEPAERFYAGALELDVTVRSYPGALFLSAGGYHHHVGANIWQTAGAPAPPAGSVGLDHWELALPDEAERDRIAGRLEDAGAELTRLDAGVQAADPSGNRLLLTVAG